MKTSLTSDSIQQIAERLEQANLAFTKRYPGETGHRQPVHTVYGGAHLFKSDTALRLGELARREFEEYAPDFVTFARALSLPGSETLPNQGAAISDLNSRLEKSPDALKSENYPAWFA